jgi:uncharacterized C2H2 Zn-finger protein
MKLKLIIAPTPKCPRCKNIYLIKRITIMGDMVYDCPKCQSVYKEDE